MLHKTPWRHAEKLFLGVGGKLGLFFNLGSRRKQTVAAFNVGIGRDERHRAVHLRLVGNIIIGQLVAGGTDRDDKIVDVAYHIDSNNNDEDIDQTIDISKYDLIAWDYVSSKNNE